MGGPHERGRRPLDIDYIPKAGEERALNAFWADAMLACVGEMFEDSLEVCGLKSPFGHCGMPGPAGLPLPWA